MYKDPTKFRKRFQAYKDGKMPYKNGRPAKFEDGTEPNLFQRPDKSYFYQNGDQEVDVFPLISPTGTSPNTWTFVDNSGKIYTPQQQYQPDQGEIVQSVDKNAGQRFWDNYTGELKYNLNNDRVIGGKYTLPAIGLGALGMYAAGAAGGSAMAPTLSQSVNLVGKNIWGNAARDFALSMLGGETINEASKLTTGNSWGQNISNATGGYVPQFVADFTNPGYLLSGEAVNAVLQNKDAIIQTGKNYFTRGRGLYRRARNFINPKDHNSPGIFSTDFFGQYMKPFAVSKLKSSYISNALQNNQNNRWIFNVRVKPKDTNGKFVQTESPIRINIDGNSVTGTQYGLEYNSGMQYEPLWGQNPWDDSQSTSYIYNLHVKNGLDRLPSMFGDDGQTMNYVLKNNPEFTEQLARHVANIQNQYGVPVVGSSRLISEGYFGGVPGDMEIIVPRQRLNEFENLFNFNKIRDTRGGTGVTGTSDKVLSGPEPNNLDINILDDTGTIIHQMESTRNPSKMPSVYTQNATAQSMQPPLRPLKKSADLKIPKSDGTGNYTAEEYFDELVKDQQNLTQSVIDNVFKSGQQKHVQRAFVMMNSDNPKTIKNVSTAIDHMVQQIPGMRRFSEIWPTQKFDDVAKNKEILKKIGFVPIDVDKFANNPESMKNIVDYWYMRNTVATRSVNFDPTKNASYDNVMSATRSFDNGSDAGGGGNNVLGSTFGGFTRTHTQYTYYPPVVSKPTTSPFDDVYNAFQRESTIFNDHDAVKNAIESVINENKDIKLDINDFDMFNSHFTDNVTALVNKGQISAEEADFIITQIAKKLRVSGYRGEQYSTLGKYFGAMRKPNYEFGYPSFYARRNIDSDSHNMPILPAEWGSDAMFLGDASTGAAKKQGMVFPTTAEFSDVSLEDAAKQYPENIIDLKPFVEKAKQLQSQKDAQTGINFSKGFDYDVADKASGYNEAQALDKNRAEHYRKQLDKYKNLRNAVSVRKAGLSSVKKSLLATAVIAGLPFGIVLSVRNSQNRLTNYYFDNKQQLDSIIDKKLGNGMSSMWFNGIDPDTGKARSWEALDRQIKHIIKKEMKKPNLNKNTDTHTQNELRNK